MLGFDSVCENRGLMVFIDGWWCLMMNDGHFVVFNGKWWSLVKFNDEWSCLMKTVRTWCECCLFYGICALKIFRFLLHPFRLSLPHISFIKLRSNHLNKFTHHMKDLWSPHTLSTSLWNEILSSEPNTSRFDSVLLETLMTLKTEHLCTLYTVWNKAEKVHFVRHGHVNTGAEVSRWYKGVFFFWSLV